MTRAQLLVLVACVFVIFSAGVLTITLVNSTMGLP